MSLRHGRVSLPLSLPQADTTSAKRHPPKNNPCEWVGKARSGEVGNGGLTVSLVKESSEPGIHFKRVCFRGKWRPQLSLCGIADLYWAHSAPYQLEDVETHLLSKPIMLSSYTHLSCLKKVGGRERYALNSEYLLF